MPKVVASATGPGSPLDTAQASGTMTFEDHAIITVCMRVTPAVNPRCSAACRMRADALAGRHFGELSCREFRESLLAVLPQSWNR